GVGALRGRELQRPEQRLECRYLVLHALQEVSNPELAHADAHRLGLAAADHGDGDAGAEQCLDAVTVLGAERFRLDAGGGQPRASVRDPAVDVESREPDAARDPVRRGRAHILPARNRSWMLSAPTSRRASPVTRRPLILCSSSMCTASAASTSGAIVLQLRCMTAA